MKYVLGILLLMTAAGLSAQNQSAEEIVVTGRLPGPAMWRVSKDDDHVLWIFATVSPIPKDMVWESARVEKVIGEAQEYIEPPDADVSVSPLVLLNPINYVRGYRLLNRLRKNPEDLTLKDILPPEMYQRFDALRAKYDPKNKELDELRPMFAASTLDDPALDEHGFAANREIIKRINRLLKKNRHLKRTSTEIEVDVEGGYGTLADRAEAFIDSLPLETQIACLDRQMRRIEQDIPGMISRANSWAQGYVDEYRDLPPREDESNPCFNLALVSSEKDLVAELQQRGEEKWLSAAEAALDNNAITFAVIGMEDAIRDNGLVARLKARGYAVREPD